MDHKQQARKRVQDLAVAAAPALAATAEALVPVLRVFTGAMNTAGESARKAMRGIAGHAQAISNHWDPGPTFNASSLFVVLAPRRRPAHKPCAWCTGRFKRPATHTVKWRQRVDWNDELTGVDEFSSTPAGTRQRMCEYHAGVASRYPGVKAYRFRRVP